MIVETKYTDNQELYFLDEHKVSCQCKYCNGSGKVKIKGKTFSCPNCYGKGEVDEAKQWQVLGPKYPDRIVIEKEEGIPAKICYIFKMEDIPNYIDEQDCFATRKEALEECRKRNAKKEK